VPRSVTAFLKKQISGIGVQGHPNRIGFYRYATVDLCGNDHMGVRCRRRTGHPRRRNRHHHVALDNEIAVGAKTNPSAIAQHLWEWALAAMILIGSICDDKTTTLGVIGH
jgi:hypothetical protein